MYHLGSLLRSRGDIAGAELLFREELAAKRRTLGDDHADTLFSINSLGVLLDRKGDKAGAEPLLREALAGRKRVLGKMHPDTLRSATNLGALLYECGNMAEAAPMLREALSGCCRVLGAAHEDTKRAASWLAGVLYALGKAAGSASAEAAPLFREALAAHRIKDSADATEALVSARDLADLLVSLGGDGNVAEAALLADEALAGLRRNLGESHLTTLVALRIRGRVHAAQGDFAGAAAAFRA